MTTKPPFVAFEGIDKSGKGTQSLIAKDMLHRAWGDCIHFSEPNDRDSMIGRHIRKILKHELPAPAPRNFQRLYVIDRAQDTVSIVLPALGRGIPVVAERFALSTIAYGSLQDSPEEYVRMHREVLGPWLCWPDLTVIIDIPGPPIIMRPSHAWKTTTTGVLATLSFTTGSWLRGARRRLCC